MVPRERETRASFHRTINGGKERQARQVILLEENVRESALANRFKSAANRKRAKLPVSSIFIRELPAGNSEREITLYKLETFQLASLL